MPRLSRLLACLLTLSALTGGLSAHPDLEERIAMLTEQLRAAPEDADLLVRRGRLYHDHGEWSNALADFDRALAVKPDLDALHLMRSAALARAGRHADSLAAADRYLERHPLDGEGLVLRARALVALGEPGRAAAELDLAIDRLPDASIDLFVERARVLASGDHPDLDAALASLDGAMERVGPVVSLRLEAVSLARSLSHHDLALARLADLIGDTPRPARLLQLQAEILCEAGRDGEALRSVDRAIGEIDSMPPRTRSRPAFVALRASLSEQAEALRAGAPLPRAPRAGAHAAPSSDPEPGP